MKINLAGVFHSAFFNRGFANQGFFQRRPARTLAGALTALAILTIALPPVSRAQDQDDPPSRVARLGYMEGSVSFEPAGENDWVQAFPNRPMTTGDQLWVDNNSRAEVQLGPTTINLWSNTGFSFLNLDDQTVQIQLTAGAINLRVRELDPNTIFEVDTPNQAFTVTEPGRYRVEASENGDYTVVTIREGAGESTGNGQSYTLHAGQRTTFSGTTSLNAEVEDIGEPDDFDNWSDQRYQRYDDSPSARYCSRDVVGFSDLDDNGDWHAESEYGPVWFPRVVVGWAPYHVGHWAWIDPWGWTWVDDDPWGYAPFHYGRWLWIQGRWGWVPGPPRERPVYAPALVVFVGGGGLAFGGNVAWFPLGPREVYVPSYPVSQAYVNRVNISNTTVNVTTVTNVYNTTIINKTTTITNVTYVNRSVQGAVTAVPQAAFASAQPVAKVAVAVNAQEIARAPISSRAAVPPSNQAVLGAHANTAGHVSAPPAAVAKRVVVAKTAPPPPPPSFASRQQILAQHPGEPIARQQLQKMVPAAAVASRVKRAPPAKPATATPAPNRANQPANRPATPPANARPAANPAPARPQPSAQPSNQPAPANRPAESRPQPNRAEPAQPARPAPNNRPETNRPESNRPETRPQPTPPPAARPEPNRPAEQPRTQPAPRPSAPPPAEHQQQRTPPPQARPAPAQQHPAAKPQKPEEKKPEEKKNEKPQ
jgi:hypothetical protein